jgi:fused signal recognition particle receptor
MADAPDEQNNEPEATPGAADATPRRRIGFFSRLFADRGIDADAGQVLEEDEGALPRSMEDVPVLDGDAALEPEAPSRKGFFGRMFKRAGEGQPSDTPAQDKPAEPAAPRVSWIKRLAARLGRTRENLLARVKSALGLSGKLDEDTIEEIEAILLQSDVAMETTAKIIERMRAEVRRREKDVGPEVLLDVFKTAIRDPLENAAPGFQPRPKTDEPYVVMVVGVNGVGKTTTVAKMALRCTSAGLKTMLVAGDTFRAAAVEQLEIWAGRTGCEFMRAGHGSDPAALAYDAVARARAKGVDVVFFDTAGRLHTKTSLMDELGKVARVLDKQLPGAPHETLLVLDATTGQNAIQQVKLFSSAVKVTGLVMTKLDGTAKGGVLLSILDMFRIPITLIGVGEKADDLRDFDPDQFARALFGETGEE